MCLCLIAAAAQEGVPADAPPPAKIIPKAEKVQLEAETKFKDRTKLSLELMDSHLRSAEAHHDAGDMEAMFAELGMFHALVDDALAFLNKSGKSDRKALDSYKRLEIGLRGFAPRLELIRRDVPLSYEYYVRNLSIFLRNARARAVEPMFSDTIVPTKKPNN